MRAVVCAPLGAGMLLGILLGSSGCEGSCEDKRNCGPYDGVATTTSGNGGASAGGATTTTSSGVGGEGAAGGGGVSSLGSPVGVAAGEKHSCAWFESGRAFCWGDNSEGQLGTGLVNGQALAPVPVLGLDAIQDVSAGFEHTCAVNEDLVWCWGQNLQGQLGLGFTSPREVSPMATGFSASEVSLPFSDHTCVRSSTGTVSCWGGRLAETPSTILSPEVFVATGVTSLGRADFHMCAVASTVLCWGANYADQVKPGGSEYELNPTTSFSTGTDISGGLGHTCVLQPDETVRCQGSNNFGQRGTTGTGPVSNLLQVKQIEGGADHTCARLADRTVRCWGRNHRGQLGNPQVTADTSLVPVIAAVQNVIALAVGANHACAIAADDSVFCWGGNAFGQLGNGMTDTDGTSTPIRVSFP